MKGIICYYSGTGNTKLACRYIQDKLHDTQLDLFDIARDGTPDLHEYGLVAFATFTDYLGPPFLMKRFIEDLPDQDRKPCFVFNTFGFMSGKTLPSLGKWATAKGFNVFMGHSLHTPESFPPMIIRGKGYIDAPNDKELAKFEAFILKLRTQVRLRVWEGKEPVHEKLQAGIIGLIVPMPKRTKSRIGMGKKFVDFDRCVECGICQDSCPYGAITMDPKPAFDQKKCYGCWSCFNHCPKKAIYTTAVKGQGHYPHPHKNLRRKLKIR
jgi:ferredoxin